jgi:hypothetical protein
MMMMKRFASLLMTGMLLFGASTYAADAPSTTQESSRDPKAIDRLAAMGNYLRGLKVFAVHADTTNDEVLENNQKLQFAGTVDYLVQPPNHLRLEVKNDRRHRTYTYNGETLTQYAPRIGYYATIDLTGKLGEVVQQVKEKYDLDMPLADLFLWGTSKADPKEIKEANFIGVERIGNKECDHFAFRQEGVDWQICIQQGKQPLPLKLIITTTDEPSQPQYAALLKWNLSPKLSKKDFTFTPPKDSKKIEMVPFNSAAENN